MKQRLWPGSCSSWRNHCLVVQARRLFDLSTSGRRQLSSDRRARVGPSTKFWSRPSTGCGGASNAGGLESLSTESSPELWCTQTLSSSLVAGDGEPRTGAMCLIGARHRRRLRASRMLGALWRALMGEQCCGREDSNDSNVVHEAFCVQASLHLRVGDYSSDDPPSRPTERTPKAHAPLRRQRASKTRAAEGLRQGRFREQALAGHLDVRRGAELVAGVAACVQLCQRERSSQPLRFQPRLYAEGWSWWEHDYDRLLHEVLQAALQLPDHVSL